MAGDPAAALVHARRPAVDHRAARIEVDHQPRAVDLVVARVELDVADQGDQLAVEVVDPEVALGRFRRAVDDHAAGRVEPVDLDVAAAACAARISDRQPRRVERQLGLRDMDVAGEDRAVGAVLDFDPVGGDVDRRIAVVALERRDRLLLLLTCADAAVAASGRC